MLKKRIIFSLLYKDGMFCLSRNFRLQEIGDIEWLMKSYSFEEISGSIDELIILNVGSKENSKERFFSNIDRIIKNFFVPITIGGNVRSLNDAREYFLAGADKISLNTLYIENEMIATEISRVYGSQAVVASIDYKKISTDSGNIYRIYENESERLEIDLLHQIKKVQELGCGELLIRSIANDGTGNGLDLELLSYIPNDLLTVPLIFAGGIGKSEHMETGLSNFGIDAVCTANLLNFINQGLVRARKELELKNLPISQIFY
jgi:cyclase